MVKAAFVASLCFLSAAIMPRAGMAADLTTLALQWPSEYVVTGTKTEPTYIEHIRLERMGDIFTLEGGAPAGMAPSRATIAITDLGRLRYLACPAPANCRNGAVPSGFLASAAIVALTRRGKLELTLPPLRYGKFDVVCVPGEAIGIARPVLDPCVEIHTGAVIAQRHRLSHRFDGLSLDPWSIKIAIPGQVVMLEPQGP